MLKLISKIAQVIINFIKGVIGMGNKITYNDTEYNGSIVNDTGVGEFTSNNKMKNVNPGLNDGSNNEIFNMYVDTSYVSKN